MPYAMSSFFTMLISFLVFIYAIWLIFFPIMVIARMNKIISLLERKN